MVDTARRELLEETGLHAGDIEFLGRYGGAERDPRLIESSVFVGRVEEEAVLAEGGDASGAQWVPVGELASGARALAFDHARILLDALAHVDGEVSPYLAGLERVAAAADRRNAALLDEVERLFGRGIATDRSVLLAEYTALKAESTQRIQVRDNFINLNIVAVAAILSVVAAASSHLVALLAIPWVTLCFGWQYLANDEKITALARYCKFSLDARLGGDVLRWEHSPKRATRLRNKHKATQLVVDLAQFVVPGLAAPIGYMLLVKHLPTTAVVVAAVELGTAVVLAGLIVIHSDIVDHWDYTKDDWRKVTAYNSEDKKKGHDDRQE